MRPGSSASNDVAKCISAPARFSPGSDAIDMAQQGRASPDGAPYNALRVMMACKRPSNRSMLEADHLAAHRGSTTLFQDLTFGVEAGRALVVTGPNGAGKTTLLRIVAGLTAPSGGTLRFQGSAVQPFDAMLRAQVLFAAHTVALSDELTAEENVEAQVKLAGSAVTRDAVRKALDMLGLGAQRTLPVRVLSSGQRRRVALARLRLVKRRLWVLDEPFTALDAAASAALAASIRSHLHDGGAALVATHQPLNLEPGLLQALAVGSAY